MGSALRRASFTPVDETYIQPSNMYKLLSFLVILAVAFAAPAPEPGVAFAAPALYKAPLGYGPAIGYAALPAAPAIQYNAPYYAAYPAAQIPYGRIY